ncbi:hypothetical protein Hanom_Chr00s000002g01601081 [Helianthus anomalus]
MKVKNSSEPVLGTPKVGTEFVLKIFWFGKFGTGTQNNLLISDHRFHTNNIVTIQLFWLIFFGYLLVFSSTFFFIAINSSVLNTLVVISKHM